MRVWILLLGLAACGFQPIYAPGGPAVALEGRVAVDVIDSVEGFALRERLIERLGRAEAPAYRLRVGLRYDSDGLAITQDSATTRFTLTGLARWEVRRGDAIVLADESRATSPYNATGSTFATEVAERDARLRIARQLADQIALRLAATAGQW